MGRRRGSQAEASPPSPRLSTSLIFLGPRSSQRTRRPPARLRDCDLSGETHAEDATRSPSPPPPSQPAVPLSSSLTSLQQGSLYMAHTQSSPPKTFSLLQINKMGKLCFVQGRIGLLYTNDQKPLSIHLKPAQAKPLSLCSCLEFSWRSKLSRVAAASNDSSRGLLTRGSAHHALAPCPPPLATRPTNEQERRRPEALPAALQRSPGRGRCGSPGLFQPPLLISSHNLPTFLLPPPIDPSLPPYQRCSSRCPA